MLVSAQELSFTKYLWLVEMVRATSIFNDIVVINGGLFLDFLNFS